MLQVRISSAIDHDLQNTQFGFRKARSTSTPLACVYRLMERVEASKDPLFLVFLDWEKAFDRVRQDKLLEALSRMGMPSAYIMAVQSLYNNPQFAVRMGTQFSSWRTQQRGIRQGCPLSPYLFIILMTVMFRDIHSELNLDRGRLGGLDYTELLYADDTVLFTTNVNAMNRLLAKIEEHASYYGLNFNKSKCVAFSFHSDKAPTFADGSKVPMQDDVTYLGGVISKTGDIRRLVNRKISSCFGVLSKLNEFWLRSSCPHNFKITVFDAVVRSKLVYGLEGVHLPKSVCAKLDAFQLKGLRKILGMQTTFMNRSNTNQKVFQMASRIKNPSQAPNRDVRSFSNYVQSKQRALLKHTIRAPDSDPLRQCTFLASSSTPILTENRRVGRPRDKWAYSIMEGYYTEMGWGGKTDFKQHWKRECDEIGKLINARIL